MCVYTCVYIYIFIFIYLFIYQIFQVHTWLEYNLWIQSQWLQSAGCMKDTETKQLEQLAQVGFVLHASIKGMFRSPQEGHLRNTVSFHKIKSQNFKLSVSNPKSKYVAYLSVLSQISNCQSLGRKNKHEILKTDHKQCVLSAHMFSRPARSETKRPSD